MATTPPTPPAADPGADPGDDDAAIVVPGVDRPGQAPAEGGDDAPGRQPGSPRG